MVDPHAHHTLFKKGLGAKQQELVNEGQEILREIKIDPVFGKENLNWAPNRVKGQHGIEALQKVVDTLKSLKAEGAEYDDFVDALQRLAQEAAQRK